MTSAVSQGGMERLPGVVNGSLKRHWAKEEEGVRVYRKTNKVRMQNDFNIFVITASQNGVLDEFWNYTFISCETDKKAGNFTVTNVSFFP